LCPNGYSLGVDHFNAAACCLTDAGAGTSMLDASAIDAVSDASNDIGGDAPDSD
jgi:hypothetical protein